MMKYLEYYHPSTEGHSVLFSPQATSVELFNSIAKNSKHIEDISIPARLKSIKNKTEIAEHLQCYDTGRCGTYEIFHWFESNLGREPMTENSLSEKLLEFRSQQKDFLGSSFATITAFNENSALPHYNPEEGTSARDRGERVASCRFRRPVSGRNN